MSERKVKPARVWGQQQRKAVAEWRKLQKAAARAGVDPFDRIAFTAWQTGQFGRPTSAGAGA